MPALSRVYLRTAMIYLALGVLLGGILLWNKGALIGGNIWIWLAAHISLVTWGWLWQVTFGVAFWILPRFGTSRGRAWLAWLAYGSVNIAIVLAALSPWLHGPWPTAIAGLLQAVAAIAFTCHAWPRVKPSTYGA